MEQDRKPDYWCYVALDYLGDCAYVVAESDDCVDDGLLDDADIFDVVGMKWARSRGAGPGLYRLTLTINETDDISVTASDLIVAFPPLPTDGPDYLKITHDVLHDDAS